MQPVQQIAIRSSPSVQADDNGLEILKMTIEKMQHGSPVARRLAFFKGLQLVTNRIHASNDTDEIILELSSDLCALFDAARLTIYTLDEEARTIVTRIKTGLDKVQSIRLPVSDNSIAGYVAHTGLLVNVGDVYDETELRAISPRLHFQHEVDVSSGFRSRQMLVAPIRDPEGDRIIGVIQLINTINGEPFSKVAEEGLLGLTQTLGVAFARHSEQPARLRSRFDALVADGRITAEELRQAIREARSGDLSTEAILVDDLGLTSAEIGEAAARYFGVPYQAFRENHVKPMDLLRNIKRDYVQQSHWLPYEETQDGVVVLCVDPEQVRSSGVAQNVLPKKRLTYRVTSAREFELTVEQYFGTSLDDASVNDLLSDLDEGADEAPGLKDDVTAAADNELVKLSTRSSSKRIARARPTSTSNPGLGARKPWSVSARTVRSCPTSRCQPVIATRWSRASRSCATSTSPSAASPRMARSSSVSLRRLMSSCASPRCRRRAGWKTS